MVKREKVKRQRGRKFIVNIGELVIDPNTNEKFVTIIVNKKIMHYITEGLSKYKEGLSGHGLTSQQEKEEANIVIDEFSEVKDVLNEEIIDDKSNKGKQEPTT